MNVFRGMKLSWKLNLILGIILVAAFGCLIGFNLNSLHRLSLLHGEAAAKDEISDMADRFDGKMEQVRSMLETLNINLQQQSAAGQPGARDNAIAVLKKVLDGQKELLGLYTLWEPNAYDNNDKANANKTGYDDATGRFIPYVFRSDGRISIEPLKDYEKEGAGDYYLIAKKTKKVTLIEPYFYNVGGSSVLMTSLIVPLLDDKGQFVGIVRADIALSSLQKQIEAMKPFDGYVTLISAKGNYVAHGRNAELATKPYGDTAEKRAIMDRHLTQFSTEYTNSDTGDGIVERLFQPIRIEGSDSVWLMEAVVPRSTILASYYDSLYGSIGLAAVTLLLLFGAMFLIIRKLIVSRVIQVNRIVATMAQGDFTNKLDIRSGDEFGAMAGHMNAMIGSLRGMLGQVSDHAMTVAATSEQLAASAEQTSQAADRISAAVDEVSAGAGSQLHTSLETSRAMQEMASGIMRIAESSSLVAESSQHITENTSRGNAVLRQAVAHMNESGQTVEQAERIVANLGQRSQEIGDIIGLITQISTQTNLLALNASIEAARAGEHGRGFAVVAGEVKKLAEQTKTASGQVAEMIEDIQKQSARAVAIMKAVADAVALGSSSVTESGHLLETIMERMEHVNEQIQEVSAASEQMSACTQEVTASVEQLAQIAERASDHSQSVAAAATGQKSTIGEISGASNDLSVMMQELSRLIGQFKV